MPVDSFMDVKEEVPFGPAREALGPGLIIRYYS
jgi:hypothetical protein